MEREDSFMLKQARVDSWLGYATMSWIILVYLSGSNVLDALTFWAPKNAWLFAGVFVGGCQVIMSRNPQRYISSALHWPIAFAGAIFWVYVAYTASYAISAGYLIVLYWAVAAASLWDLGHA